MPATREDILLKKMLTSFSSPGITLKGISAHTRNGQYKQLKTGNLVETFNNKKFTEYFLKLLFLFESTNLPFNNGK